MSVALGELYREGRRRITDLVAGLDGSHATAQVPACPDWSVADVLAHLAGSCADILAGRVDGVATPEWTAAQVAVRRGRTITELIDEWSEVGPAVESIAHLFPEPAAQQWIADLTTHEHDLRGALRKPGARDSRGLWVGLQFLVLGGMHPSLRARGLAPLQVRAGRRSWVVGTDSGPSAGSTSQQTPGRQVTGSSVRRDETAAERSEPTQGLAFVEGPPFELFRALAGRRSAAQIRRWNWGVDPEPYVPAFQFGPFTTSAADIDE